MVEDLHISLMFEPFDLAYGLLGLIARDLN